MTRVRLHRAHPGRAARGWSDGPAASPPSTGRPAAASRRRRPVAERRSAGRPSCATGPLSTSSPDTMPFTLPAATGRPRAWSLSVTPPRVSATEVRDRQRCHVRRPADRVDGRAVPGTAETRDEFDAPCLLGVSGALPGWPRRRGRRDGGASGARPPGDRADRHAVTDRGERRRERDPRGQEVLPRCGRRRRRQDDVKGY